MGGLFLCVLSDSIRDETSRVLTERFDWSAEAVEDVLGGLWARAEWVQLGTDSAQYHDLVHDERDVHVIRCAMGVYESRPDLSDARRFLVSNDTHAFRAGINSYGFEFVTADQFWRLLRNPRE